MVEEHEIKAALEYFKKTIPRYSQVLKTRPTLLVKLHKATMEGKIAVRDLQKLGTHYLSQNENSRTQHRRLLDMSLKVAMHSGTKEAINFILTHHKNPEDASLAQYKKTATKTAPETKLTDEELERIKPLRKRERLWQDKAITAPKFGEHAWQLDVLPEPKDTLPKAKAEKYAEAIFQRDVRPETRVHLERWIPPKLLRELKIAYVQGKLDKDMFKPGDVHSENFFEQMQDYAEIWRLTHIADVVRPAHPNSNYYAEHMDAFKEILKRTEKLPDARHKAHYLKSMMRILAGYQGCDDDALKAAQQNELLGKRHITPEALSHILYREGYTIQPRKLAASIEIHNPITHQRKLQNKLIELLDPVHFQVKDEGYDKHYFNGAISINAKTHQGREFIDQMNKLPKKAKLKMFPRRILNKVRSLW